MRRILRLLLGFIAGAALMSYFRTESGKKAASGLAGTARDFIRSTGASLSSPDRDATVAQDQDALKRKIAETRSRLEAELHEKPARDDPA